MTTQQPLTLQNQPSQRAPAETRLTTTRRLYFYLVLLISSTAALFAVDGIASALAETWLGGDALFTINSPGYIRQALAQSTGLLLVSVPIFLVHWFFIRRRLDIPGEREAALRKFFLYVASGIAVAYALVNAHSLLSGIARLALGSAPEVSTLLPAQWFHYLLTLLASGALLFYWQRTMREDGDYGAEEPVAATWRRLFLSLVTLAGLAMLVVGSARIFSTLIQGALPSTILDTRAWFSWQLGSGISLFLLGAVTARTSWMAWRSVSRAHPYEESSTLKRLFLYVAIVGSAIATLVPAAVIVRDVLLWIFEGRPVGVMELLGSSLATPLGYLPAGIILWVAFRDYLHNMEGTLSATAADQRDAVTIRRIYFYAVAATGLVLVWLGAVRIVQVLFDWLLTSDIPDGASFWQQPLASGLSLLVVGVPVWALHWQAVQRVAREETVEGSAERVSLPRRIYLYGVAFVGAVLILSYLAQVLYRFLLFAMGDLFGGFFTAQLAEDLARALIAAVLWVVHFNALRADGDLSSEDTPANRWGGSDWRRRDQISRRIGNLEGELVRLRSELDEIEVLEDDEPITNDRAAQSTPTRPVNSPSKRPPAMG